MILRLSSNAQRAVVVAASFAAALALSYFSIRNALAAHYVGLQTGQSFERAARLEPTDPQNSYLLGRDWPYNLEVPRPAPAIHPSLPPPPFLPPPQPPVPVLPPAHDPH